ncbi:RNA polymerase sigma-70 factor [Pedobacter gandavensis]|uniref:RNA polymerase sigma factor n=1 Tax=Pedobacter gandavensis TaxID=2679963 RepID=UPI00292F57D9|nr:RNA polymerase sigma-70 factor [Pedobacter gandavensis]
MNQTSALSDEQLLHAFQSGNKQAYELIYERYWMILFRHAQKILQDEEEAKDVIQEVFTTFWLKAESLLPTQPIAAFLYATTRNKVLDHLKRTKVKTKYIEALRLIMEQHSPAPDERIIEKELARQIENEIQLLSPRMREIFRLSREQHQSYKEIAKELNISDNTVKKQISTALHILRNKFQVFFSLF